MAEVALSQQIEEVERELAFRRGAYPRQVATGKLTQAKADHHMARLEAVKRTLLWLQTNEAKVREAVRAEKVAGSVS